MKKYNQYNFVINKKLKNKILNLLKTLKVSHIFDDEKLKNELIKDNKNNLQDLFIKHLELFINNIFKTYFLYNNLKKKYNYQTIKKKIHIKLQKKFNKNIKKSDIDILLFIYDNIFDEFKNKWKLVDFIKNNIINNDLYKTISIKFKNIFKLKGGFVPEGFFDSDPTFPNPPPTSTWAKIKTYLFVLWYMENKWPWMEYFFLVLDIIIDLVGLIPVIGDIVDAVGLAIAILRKDMVGAILQAIAIIPVAGSIINTPISVLRNIKRMYEKYQDAQMIYDTYQMGKEVYSELTTDDDDY